MGNLIACGGKPVTSQTVVVRGVYVVGNLKKEITFTFPEKIIGVVSISLSNGRAKIGQLQNVSGNTVPLLLYEFDDGQTTDIAVVANGY